VYFRALFPKFLRNLDKLVSVTVRHVSEDLNDDSSCHKNLSSDTRLIGTVTVGGKQNEVGVAYETVGK
jgi:hypothetical protein